MMGSTAGGFTCKVIRSENLQEAPKLSFPLTQTETHKRKNPREERRNRKKEKKKKRQEQEIGFIDFALSSLPIVSRAEESWQVSPWTLE